MLDDFVQTIVCCNIHLNADGLKKEFAHAEIQLMYADVVLKKNIILLTNFRYRKLLTNLLSYNCRSLRSRSSAVDRKSSV